jgi:hypothetical protein
LEKAYIDKAIVEKEADEASSVASIHRHAPGNNISHNLLGLGASFIVESHI